MGLAKSWDSPAAIEGTAIFVGRYADLTDPTFIHGGIEFFETEQEAIGWLAGHRELGGRLFRTELCNVQEMSLVAPDPYLQEKEHE